MHQFISSYMRRSFIGYSNAFPKLIQDLFGYIIDEAGEEIPNPNAPTCGSVSCGFLGECICAVAYMNSRLLMRVLVRGCTVAKSVTNTSV
jgi:hypothetical protein